MRIANAHPSMAGRPEAGLPSHHPSVSGRKSIFMAVTSAATHLPTPMFKRFILCLILILSLSGADHAKAAGYSPYRSYADSYLKSAVSYALETYNSAGSSNSSSAYYAYLYSLYAKYNGEISAWVAAYGNTTLTDLYNYYSYLFSSYSLTSAYQAYANSSGANSTSAYNSYLYSYYGTVYAYYAWIYR
jgi:hypothetical protein